MTVGDSHGYYKEIHWSPDNIISGVLWTYGTITDKLPWRPNLLYNELSYTMLLECTTIENSFRITSIQEVSTTNNYYSNLYFWGFTLMLNIVKLLNLYYYNL